MISVPVLLTCLVWCWCRRAVGVPRLAGGFILGAVLLVPIGRASSFLSGAWVDPTGHYYFDELLENFVTTAMPEEIGKNLAALFALKVVGRSNSGLAWLVCGAAAHSGFAAIEGLLGTLGNEGLLIVVIGRSLGALSHLSWGIIAAWFFWRGSSGKGNRCLNWCAGLLIPMMLHALDNASLAEVPGATMTDDATPPPEAILIMLSGMAVLMVSVAGAVGCVVNSRRRSTASSGSLRGGSELSISARSPSAPASAEAFKR